MTIGVMLRTMHEKQGIGVYTQNLMNHLLPLDQHNEYVLFYRNPEFLGQYAQYPNVREKLVTAPNKLIWDQVKIPLAVKREGVDLIFHTKFTVPIFTRAKSVMVLHGSEWYVYPQFSERMDILYIKLMMPIYHRRAAAVISVSNRAKEDMNHYVAVHKDKIKTVYLAPDPRFRQDVNGDVLRTTRDKYNLPEKFIFNAGGIYPGKNIKRVLMAYANIRHKIPHKLVLAGVLRRKYHDELKPIQEYGLEDDVVFPGWIPQKDMPALYKLADLFLFPSFYESCSVALLEAMASGCPIVTTNTGGTPEIIGDSAILLDPMDTDGIAEAVERVLSNRQLRQELVDKGLKQSQRFSWEKCARETLSVLEHVGRDARLAAELRES